MDIVLITVFEIDVPGVRSSLLKSKTVYILLLYINSDFKKIYYGRPLIFSLVIF